VMNDMNGMNDINDMDYILTFNELEHGPLTKGRFTQRFLSEGVMEAFLTKIFILASREG
jgi:hypothetical protein